LVRTSLSISATDILAAMYTTVHKARALAPRSCPLLDSTAGLPLTRLSLLPGVICLPCRLVTRRPSATGTPTRTEGRFTRFTHVGPGLLAACPGFSPTLSVSPGLGGPTPRHRLDAAYRFIRYRLNVFHLPGKTSCVKCLPNPAPVPAGPASPRPTTGCRPLSHAWHSLPLAQPGNDLNRTGPGPYLHSLSVRAVQTFYSGPADSSLRP